MEVEGFRVAKKDSGSSGITNPNSRQMTEMQWLDGEHQSRRPFGAEADTRLSPIVATTKCRPVMPSIQNSKECQKSGFLCEILWF